MFRTQGFGMARRKALDSVSLKRVPDAAPDRRIAQRFVTIYRPGKIVSGDDEELCLVRNVSVSGAMVQVSGSFAKDDRVVLYLKLEDPIEARVAWARDSFIGLEFDSGIDLAHRIGPDKPGTLRSRAPRLNVPAPARVQLGRDVMQVVTSDISQSGAKLCCAFDCPPGTQLRLTIDNLGTFPCVVRWSRNGVAGVSFLRPIAIWDLNGWARSARTGVGRIERIDGTAKVPNPLKCA